jgi:hypothetical protein
MDKFASIELRLGKSIKRGNKESLLSLFSAAERFKPMGVLLDADEDTNMKVILEGLGEADIKLGADMEKGQKKTIMTLFWYSERSKPIEMKREAEEGESITLSILKN